MKTEKQKTFYYIFLFLFAILAFLIRIEVIRSLIKLDTNVLFPSSVTDMYTYFKLASEVASGAYDKLYVYQPFYYAVFLAAIFKYISENILLVLIVQALLGSLTVYFAAQSAKKLWDRKTGLITAALITFSQILIFYTSYLLIVTIQAFLITMLLYFSLIAYRKKGVFYWGLTGLILGCSILTRGNMWFVLPGLSIIVLIRGIFQNKDKNFIRKVLPFFVFTACVIMPQIPFVYSNTVQSGKLSGPSMAAGDVLLFGNTPESPPGGNEPQYGAGIINQTETGKYWKKSENTVSVVRRIWEYFLYEPLSYLELNFRKLLLFWNIDEIPNNVDFNSALNVNEVLKFLGLIPTFIILILGGAGVVFFIPYIFKVKSDFILPLCIFISYWVGICLFYMLARFRAPIIPLLSVYGAGMFAYMFSYNKRKSTNVYVGLLLLIIFSFITFYGYSYYRYYVEYRVMRYVRPNGTFVNLGDKNMVLDNGPAVYGSWRDIVLTPGTEITKIFIFRDLEPDSMYIEIPFIFNKSGDLLIMVNGIEYKISSDKAGLVMFKNIVEKAEYVKADKSSNKDIRIIIRVLNNTGNACAFIDYQRNYGRTMTNGKKIPGELVCKLFLTKSNASL